MNLSGLKASGWSKCLGSLVMNCRLDMKVELGGKINPSTITEVLFWWNRARLETEASL